MCARSPSTTKKQLVNEAFGNAAFNAVKQISKFNPAGRDCS